MTVVKQHLISKVLLKQFANSGGELFSHNLEVGHGRLRTPASVAWSKSFVDHDPHSTEALWGEVEHDLAQALAQLKSGESLTDDSVAALKDTVALHFLRRLRVRELWERSLNRRLQKSEIAERVARRFPDRDSLAIADAVVSQVSEEAASWFQEGLTDLFARSRAFAAARQLSVFFSLDAQYLIGDNAVLSFDANGVIGRKAFAEASQHLLPVAPQHLISLSDVGVEEEVTREFVLRMNRLQVSESQSHVFFAPGHSFDELVGEAPS